MSLENIGAHTVKQTTNAKRSEQTAQHAQNQQMNQLLNTHNQMMTMILKQGLNIPKDTFEKIQREAGPLKHFFFGLDNQLFSTGMLPEHKDDFIIFHTQTTPVVVPKMFFEDGHNEADIFSEGLVVNLLKNDDWWNYENYELESSKFLKVGLVFFSHENFLKHEAVKRIETIKDPYIPEKAIVFSRSCNFFALLMFFYTNKQYFENLNTGIRAFLSFINKK